VAADDSAQRAAGITPKIAKFLLESGNKSLCRTLKRGQIVAKTLPESAANPPLFTRRCVCFNDSPRLNAGLSRDYDA
jgi:hypothetical protein